MVFDLNEIPIGADEGSANGEYVAGESAAPRLAAKLLSRAALKTLPTPEPLIDNVLDQGTVALLYGKWGTCKSFIAIDWAASVATGRAWQARRTEQRRVLYIAAEGAFGMAARVDAWESGWCRTIGEGDLEVLPEPVNLTQRADVADLIALVGHKGYGLIVVDTLARSMVGADENSARDCGEVIDALTRLRDATPDRRGVVLGVHHAGKDGKTFRGSSAFEAGADIVYATAEDHGVVTLEREKRKDGPSDDRHELFLDLIPGTRSGVLNVHLEVRGVDKSSRADRLMSTFVQNFVSTGATKAELRLVAGMPPVTFHRAINDLLESGRIINTGTDKRPHYKAASK
jgi:hypothetical protein